MAKKQCERHKTSAECFTVRLYCIPHWYEAFRTGINEVAKDTFFKILFNDPELQIKLKTVGTNVLRF
jgi:hypothetical protein